jgi:hypothetical protein
MDISDIPIYDKKRFYEKALKASGEPANLIKLVVDEEADTVSFQTIFDGKIHKSVGEAIGSIETFGLNTFKTIGPDSMATAPGLRQVAAEAAQISKSLKSLSSVQREAIQKMGLSFLIDQDITIDYSKYNYAKRKDQLSLILESQAGENAGLKNITDEGVTLLNYRVGEKLLSAQQAKQMKYVLGIGTLTDSFADNLLGSDGLPDFSKFAKLQKRVQGMVSERQVSLAGDLIRDMYVPDGSGGRILDKPLFDLLKETTDFREKDVLSGVYKFDEMSFFRAMFNIEDTTQAERFILSGGMGFSEDEMRLISLMTLDGDKQTANKTITSISQFRQRLISQYGEITGITDSEKLSRIHQLYQDSGNNFSDFKKAIKKMASQGGPDQELAILVENSFTAIEQIRDGEAIMNLDYVDQFIKRLQEQRKSIVDSATTLSNEDLLAIRELDSDIEALLKAKKNGLEGIDSITARIHGPGMQGKAELFLKRFSWLPAELLGKMLILPESAYKTEIQGVPSILLNIAMSHGENVYSDPQMFLYHQDYFGSEQFMKGAQKNIDKQMKGISDFLESGALPDDIREQIFGAIKSEAAIDDQIFAKLDAAQRASYMRAREEARAIQMMLQSGIDPRNIPQLVRRITDFYSTNAFRLKNERLDIVMPDTMRVSLRTAEGSMLTDPLLDLYGKVNVSRPTGLPASAADDMINLVKFRLRDKRLMMNGAAANLYHHSLGTFDLDDKGVPLMTTFKDSQGNDRLAFMTMRQPTGFQEKIFMQADLADKETLLSVIKSSSGDFSKLLNDSEAVNSLSDEKERRIFQIMKDTLNGKKNIDFENISSDEVEKVYVKLRNSFGEKYGFVDLMQISSRDMIEMIESKSASALGTDKIFMGEQYKQFLASRGITGERIPDYTRGNFVNIMKKDFMNLSESRIVDEFNKIQGTRYSTLQQVTDAMSAMVDGSDKLQFRSNYLTAIDNVQVSLQEQAAKLLNSNNSLGYYINRQSAVVSMSQQVDDVIDSLMSRGVVAEGYEGGLREYYKRRFSFAITDPSSAVDLSKALLGEIEIEEGLMRQISAAIDELSGTGTLNQEIIEGIIEEFTGRKVNLGLFGEMAVKKTGRGVGYLRAKQIALGNVPIDELIGFDRALFEQETGYGRLKSIEDQKAIIESFIEGAEEAKGKLKDRDQIARIDDFIRDLQGKTFSEQISRLYLSENSKYNVTSRLMQVAKNAEAQSSSLRRMGMRTASAASKSLMPVLRAKYQQQIEALVDSQDGMINRLMQIGDADIAEATFRKSYLVNEMFKGISAMAEIDKDINMLDVYDTLEATLTRQYGAKEAQGMLRSDLVLEEMSENFQNLKYTAERRRVARRSMRNYDQQTFDTLTSQAEDFGFKSLSKTDISETVATQFMKNVADMTYISRNGRRICLR